MRSIRAAAFAALVLALFMSAAAPVQVDAAAPASAASSGPQPATAPAPHRHRARLAHHRTTADSAKPRLPEPARRREPLARAAKLPAKRGAAAEPAKVAAKAPAKPAKKYEPPDPNKGTATGLPLPRFAALRSDDVNLRIGPGTRYPIAWVYKRRELPVEIEREFEVWRLVEAPDGVKGWVHQATLTGRRGFMIVGAEHWLRERPDDTAGRVALLKPGVIGRILHCDAGSEWCRVQAGDYRGWLKRQAFWGSLDGEAIN